MTTWEVRVMDFGWFCPILAPPWMTPRPLQMHFSATNLLSIWLVQPSWHTLMIDWKFSSKNELYASISWNVIFVHFYPPLRRPMRLPMAPHTPAYAWLKKYRKHSFIWVQAGLCSSIRSKVIQCSWAIVRAEMAKMATHTTWWRYSICHHQILSGMVGTVTPHFHTQFLKKFSAGMVVTSTCWGKHRP